MKNFSRAVVICLALLSAHFSAFSQATLVKDINVTPGTLREEDRDHPLFCKCGNYLYFPAPSELGYEMWKTDGTAQGTSMVKDIYKGSASGLNVLAISQKEYACIGDKLIFPASNGINGNELWVTDGTEAGTHMIKDIRPGSASSTIDNMRTVNNQVYTVMISSGVAEVWQTDGTANGTILVKTIESALAVSLVGTTDQYFYFIVQVRVGSQAYLQLWRTDGTTAGTFKVKELTSSEYIVKILGAGSKMYFITGLSNHELWVSDGSVSGTTYVTNIVGQSLPTLHPFHDNLIFSAFKENYEAETWWSDGTPAGTFKLDDVNTIASAVVGNNFYGVSSNFFQTQNYLYHLNESGSIKTSLVNLGTTANPVKGEIPVLNGSLILPVHNANSGFEMGISDGTPAGTIQLKDVRQGPESSKPRLGVTLNDKCLFVANDGTHGSEIWITDGTTNGTTMAKDVVSNTATGILTNSGLSVVDNQLFFMANSTDPQWRDLWKSDGTAAGTVLHHDFPDDITSVFGTLGSSDMIMMNQKKIYKSNAAGTTLLKDFSSLPGGYGNFNSLGITIGNKLLFAWLAPLSPGIGFEYWITDGTEAGTHVLKDIYPGSPSSVLNYSGAVLNNKFIFSAQDPTAGRELWITDGTEAGTTLVKDIRPGVDGSLSQNFVRFKDKVLFAASDGVSGPEIWQTDGTTEGTVPVTDVFPSDGLFPNTLTVAGDLVMFSGYDVTNGWAVWKTDGTNAGTQMVKDISTGASNLVQPTLLKGVGNKLFFTFDDSVNGKEIWITDGTEAGTKMVDLQQGDGGSNPTMVIDGNGIPFVKTNSGLWKIDPSGVHRQLVTNLEPVEAVYHNGWLYFTAPSPEAGTELFKVQVTKFDQSITFSPIPAKEFSADSFQLQASSSSGLPVAFTTASDKVILSSSTATFVKPGTVTVKVNQPGDASFLPAAEVANTFCIIPSTPVITHTNPGNTLAILSSSSNDGNQWFRNGILLSETGKTLSTEESGSYTVQVKIDDCASAVSDVLDVVVVSTERSVEGVSIYPNPATGVIRIETNSQPMAVSILNLQGKVLTQYHLTENQSVDHPVGDYPDGMYLIKISTPGGQRFQKFVKQ